MANNHRYVVRINRHSPDDNALDPRAEIAAMQRAAAAGLAPTLRYSDPLLGTLACDFLRGEDAALPDPAQLAELLRNIHGLPPIPHSINVADRLRHYEQRIERTAMDSEDSNRLLAHGNGIHDHWQRLVTLDPHPVLCHNDLLPENVIFSDERLWAIDWEYAGMGNRWFDIAVAASSPMVAAADRELFLAHYLERPPNDYELECYSLARRIYLYLETLWTAAHNATPSDLEQRLSRPGA